MIKNSLQSFIDRVLESRTIGDDDVRLLQRDILPHGLVCQEEADVLIALDRAVNAKSRLWADYLVSAVVDFAVWGTRPTGYVTGTAAHWLLSSLTAGGGPTATGIRIALEVVREAEHADPALAGFVLRAGPAAEPAFASVVARMA